MTYTINSAVQVLDTIITNVTLELSTGPITVDISHFRPSTMDDINSSIVNRIVSEENYISSINACTLMLSSIIIGEIKV